MEHSNPIHPWFMDVLTIRHENPQFNVFLKAWREFIPPVQTTWRPVQCVHICLIYCSDPGAADDQPGPPVVEPPDHSAGRSVGPVPVGPHPAARPVSTTAVYGPVPTYGWAYASGKTSIEKKSSRLTEFPSNE